MIVLDTNVLSEEMKSAPEPAVHGWLALQNPLDLFTTTVTEAEILYGVALKPDGRRKRDLEAAAQRILGLRAAV
jgi:toxin FitB